MSHFPQQQERCKNDTIYDCDARDKHRYQIKFREKHERSITNISNCVTLYSCISTVMISIHRPIIYLNDMNNLCIIMLYMKIIDDRFRRYISHMQREIIINKILSS